MLYPTTRYSDKRLSRPSSVVVIFLVCELIAVSEPMVPLVAFAAGPGAAVSVGLDTEREDESV